MLDWLIENGATVGVTAALVIVVGLIVFKMVKDKKNGKTGCGCGCSGCALADKCRGNSPKNEK